MRAVLFEDVGKLSVGDYPDPVIVDPGDVIVKVDTAAICGSDLHLLEGRIPGMRPGSPIGHEFVGTITEAGPDVKRFKVGDRVVGAFVIACGQCWFCERHMYSNCDRLWVLGYGMFTGDLDGTQAEYVRVPGADLNLHAVDPALSDEQAVFAGDILTTSVYICERAGIKEGDTVAIIGAGPVGLFTLMNARAYKPERIFMVDMAPAFTTALNAVRAGGTVAVIGVHSDLSYDFPLGEVWRRGVTIVMGATANVQEHWDRALDLVKQGIVDPTVIITHTMPLEDALEGYRMFASHEALKVILKP
jgi:threonine dehydrogenase-like Zn-dependent dehydrogenase